MLQYSLGIFSIAHGDIKAVTGIKVFHRIASHTGSSGLPLLDLECMALAMNCGSREGNNYVTALSAVIKAYLEERPLAKLEVATVKKPVPPLQNSREVKNTFSGYLN